MQSNLHTKYPTNKTKRNKTLKRSNKTNLHKNNTEEANHGVKYATIAIATPKKCSNGNWKQGTYLPLLSPPLSPLPSTMPWLCFLFFLLVSGGLDGFKKVAALKGENPRIIEHPMDMTVPKNGPFTFNCKAEGSPTPSVQWFKDGHELKADTGSHRIIMPTGDLFFLKVMHTRRESDAGMYWCQAKNEFGVVRSRNATLQVAFLRDEFRLVPQNMRYAQGANAIMECGAPRGFPEPQISWRKNGQTMNLNGNKRIQIVDGGNLAIQDARQSDDGRYQCVAKNVAGTRESATAYLKVHVRPFLIRGPQNQTVVVGNSVIFQCRIGGDPLPDVLWRRSGGNMPLARVKVLSDRSLRLDNVTLEDMGEYSCEADNDVGSISATGVLTVHAPPSFTIRPRNQLVKIGNEVVFECQATGYPKPTIYWSVEGNSSLLFPGYKDGRVEVTLTPERRSVLWILHFAREDSGKVVVCNALNAVGSVSSRTVITVDTQYDLPPPIIEQGPVNQTLPVKSGVTLPCRTIGIPMPEVAWYLNGIPIDVIEHERRNLSETGALTISDLQRSEDEGLYTCVASNRNGKTSWSGYLRVDTPTNHYIKFYRAPELTMYPGPPGKPQVVETTDDSVTLSWVRSNKVGASSLVGYVVEMFAKNETDSWVKVATRVHNTTYTQMELLPGVNYYFLIRAENSHGLSLPSPISEPIVVGTKYFNSGLDLSEARASLLSGDVVELNNVTNVDSTSMKLTWQVINAKYVEGFYIYARQLPDSAYNTASTPLNSNIANVNPLLTSRNSYSSAVVSSQSSSSSVSASSSTGMIPAKPNFAAARRDASNTADFSDASTTAQSSTTYRMLTILNGGTASSCTLTGLLQYTLYEFFIVPFYKSVEGKPSNSRISRTLEDIPNDAPFGMEAILLNSSAVFLKWKAPKLKAEHGILLFYHVIVRGIDTAHNFSRILTNVTIDAASPTLVLANLTEGVMYTVSVAAGNNAGVGPYCTPATLRLNPLTKLLDPFINQRYTINQDHADDVVTQPWFIILLGAILAIMMLSFGAMVFVKRKHIMMKQSALSTMRGSHHSNDVLKMPNLSRNGNGFWLDATAGGMVWRTSPSGDTLDLQKDQIADYAPVCLSTNGSGNSSQDQIANGERTQQRYVGEYSNIPTDYAEVSSFGKAPSEYGGMQRNNTSSPAPYATSSILNSNDEQPRYQQRPGYAAQHQRQQHQKQQQLQIIQHQRPIQQSHYHHQQQQQQQQQQSQQQNSIGNIYQQMSTTSEIYPSNVGNRSVYSEQYYYPKEKMNITENKLSNCHTYDSVSNQQHLAGAGTLKRNVAGINQSGRFKVLNTQPQNFQMHATPGNASNTVPAKTTITAAICEKQQKFNSLNNNSSSTGSGSAVGNVGNVGGGGVGVGIGIGVGVGVGVVNGNDNRSCNTPDLTTISKNLMDLDSSSFCYNGMADSGCGGSPSPMAMLMSHDDEHVLYHTADGNIDDIERLYVKVDDEHQYAVQQPQPQQQQHQHQPQMLPMSATTAMHPNANGANDNAFNNWRVQPIRASYNRGAGIKSNSSIGGSSSLSSCSETNEDRQQQLQKVLATNSICNENDLIYAPGSVASERSLLSNTGSSNDQQQLHNV
ncbi:protein sax-3 [Teleopsis dalmanni]|uniref:protein sax-3 n=1 Tax=Teleopsis dalmanni TaxID=139649 RepID=UPI0018CD2701|nr:protein sax-3 [Teleopsis dalmanni]